METPDDEGEWCWPKKSRVTRWRRRIDSRPAFHYLAEDDEGQQASEGLNHLVSPNAGGAQWTWKKVTVVVDWGAAETEIGIRPTERSKNGKGFKGPGGENIKNYGQQVMSVRTPEGFVRKSTWQVADVRRPLVSASHIIQAGSDLFIAKDEAYIMNRRRTGKSSLRKEGNVYVLDLFVTVSSGAAAPIKYKPMEVDAINQVADGREQRKRVTFDCSKLTVDDKSKRTETIRPNCQSEYDCVLSVKSVENDIELNGETDDEDMQDGEMGYDDGSGQVKTTCDPGQPTAH